MIRCYSGLPGSGKTTYLTQIALKTFKKGSMVYSNYPIYFKYKGLTFTSRVISSRDEMLIQPYVPGDIIIIDEAQTWFNSREFKNFTKDLLEFFTGHRHIGIDIYIGVQYPQRIDVVIREIVDTYHWFSKIFIFKSILKERRYILFDDILKESDMTDEEKREKFKSKLRIIWKKKRIFTSFDSKYLKDKLSKEFKDKYKYYEYQDIHYTTFLEDIKIKMARKKAFNKMIRELKERQKAEISSNQKEANSGESQSG